MPPKGAERAYALLREAIRDTGLVGIATIVLRDAQHLAALEVVKDAMVLTMMRYAEELVDISEYHFPAAKDVRKPELEMARTLVKNLADTWDPSQYTDEYRENLMKIIKAKLKGKEAKLDGARGAAAGRGRGPDGAPAAVAPGRRRRRAQDRPEARKTTTRAASRKKKKAA